MPLNGHRVHIGIEVPASQGGATATMNAGAKVGILGTERAIFVYQLNGTFPLVIKAGFNFPLSLLPTQCPFNGVLGVLACSQLIRSPHSSPQSSAV